MKILALDLGKFKTVACIFETQTNKAAYRSGKMVPFWIHDLIEQHLPDRVVFEIGPQAGWVHDVVASKGVPVQVANPNTEGWRWRNVKRKTDRLDALKLARLSAMGQLPMVHIPSSKMRQHRSLVAYRSKLVDRRTAIKNSIRAILTRQPRAMPAGKCGWTQKSLAALAKLAQPLADVGLEDLWRGQLHRELAALAAVETAIAGVEQKLDALADRSEAMARLRTIPGVGPRLAEALVVALDDPHRFASGKEVGSYFGLVPRQYQSGTSDRQGRITGQGNRLLRRLLVEVAWMSLRYNPWAREVYERVRRGSRSRKKIAIVAVARRLTVIAWAMLRDGTCWQPPQKKAVA